jgi:RecA-family ATPase
MNGQIPHTAQPAEQTMADILVTDYPPMKWTIPGLLPEGCVLLGGKKGSGKSMLVLNIALAVAMGGRALEHTTVEAGDVLYYDLEGNPRRLQKRAQQMLPAIGEGTPTRITVKFNAPLINQGLTQGITAWRSQHPEAWLVVLDILARVWPLQRLRSAYQSDYLPIAALQTLATELSLTILIVHHNRKAPSADDSFDELNATTGLLGAADGGMILRRARGEDNAFLHMTSRRL